MSQMITSADTLIMTDEGTHSGPQTTKVYRLANGQYRLIVKHGGGTISDTTQATKPRASSIKTQGRVRTIAK